MKEWTKEIRVAAGEKVVAAPANGIPVRGKKLRGIALLGVERYQD